MDISRSVAIAHAEEFDRWLKAHGRREPEIAVAIFKKASGKQTVTLAELQETAIRHGWIDNLGQRIDDERWAIRFVPRRPGSKWSETNRRVVRRLRANGGMTPAGLAVLPDDLKEERA